jgi:hypothetical protein
VVAQWPNQETLTSAAEFARAQLELLRIRSKRAELMAEMDLDYNTTQGLQRLAALDRCECYALTKRRRVSIKF